VIISFLHCCEARLPEKREMKLSRGRTCFFDSEKLYYPTLAVIYPALIADYLRLTVGVQVAVCCFVLLTCGWRRLDAWRRSSIALVQGSSSEFSTFTLSRDASSLGFLLPNLRIPKLDCTMIPQKVKSGYVLLNRPTIYVSGHVHPVYYLSVYETLKQDVFCTQYKSVMRECSQKMNIPERWIYLRFWVEKINSQGWSTFQIRPWQT